MHVKILKKESKNGIKLWTFKLASAESTPIARYYPYKRKMGQD